MKKLFLLFLTGLCAQLPPGGPTLEEGSPLYLTGDFTYWTSRMGGLGFAYSGFSTAEKRGRHYNIPFHSSPGFKAGVGSRIKRDGWDFFAQYTWHKNSPDKETTTGGSKRGELIPAPIANPNDAFGSLSKASGKWDLKLNVLDIDIGRNTQLTEYIKVRPFIGFKGSWQHQTFDIKLDSHFHMHQKQRYWGFGIRTGLSSSYHFSDIWSIFSDLALSGLWSHFETNRRDTILYTRDDFYTLKGVFEWDIGLRLQKVYTRSAFLFQAGYETQLWQNHNHFIYVTDSIDGDLVLQGLTIRARFDF